MCIMLTVEFTVCLMDGGMSKCEVKAQATS